MGLTLDLGERVELVPMDPHCQDITVALYRQDGGQQPEYLVHSYSRLEGVRERVEFLARALEKLAGAERTDVRLRFSCGSAHQAGAKRGFLEACKLPSTAALEPRPLRALDKRSGRNIAVASLGAGVYQVTGDGPEEDKSKRVEAIAAGFRKLAEMSPVEGSADRVAFPCGQIHDALVGLLLVRTLNLRAVLREEEAAASRGQLAAPSQQK